MIAAALLLLYWDHTGASNEQPKVLKVMSRPNERQQSWIVSTTKVLNQTIMHKDTVR